MSSILKVDTIQDADGNNIINESGNTITVGASGDTTNIIGTLNKDGVAVANTPAFLVAQSSNQSISNTTNTIVQFGTEHLDTDNAFSSNRFTVGSGKGGLYLFTLTLQMNGNITGAALGIRRFDSSGNQYSSGGGTADGFLNINISTSVQAFYASSTLQLVEGDYVEAWIYHGSGSTKTTYAPRTFFGGHKLI